MNRSLSWRAALVHLLVFSTLVVAASPPLVASQETSSVTVGSSTIGFASDWQVRVSDAQGVLLANDALGATFTYHERPDSPVPVRDNRELVEAEAENQRDFLTERDMLVEFEAEGSGTFPDGTFWQLHYVEPSESESEMIITGNADIVPGADVVTVLIVPWYDLLPGVTAAGEGITINGQPTPYARITAGDLFEAIGAPNEESDDGPVAMASEGTPSVEPSTPVADPVQDSPYQTVSNQSLAWTAPWTFDTARSVRTATNDLALLLSGPATIVVGTGTWNADDARTAALSTLGSDPAAATILDQGATYWFGVLQINGVPHGAFALTQPAPDGVALTMTMFISPVAEFANGLGQAQGAITLDGAPVLDGVDGATLQAQLEANAPAAPAAASTEVTAFVPIDSWTDEGFGYTVEWAAGWSPMDRGTTNTVALTPDAQNAMVEITALARDGSTPGSWLLQTMARFTDIFPDIEFLTPVIGESNMIVVGLFDESAIVQEMVFLDDGETVVNVTLGIDQETAMVEVVNDYRASVRIDGRVPLEGWEAIAAQLPTPPAESAAAPTQPPAIDVPYADEGMVGETHFVGPQFGTDVQWTDEWTLDTLFEPPVSSDPTMEQDDVHITWTETDAVWLGVYSVPTYGQTMDQIIDYWSSDRVIIGQYGEDAEVIDSASAPDSGAILVRASGFVPTYFYEEYRFSADGSTLAIIQFGTLGTSDMEDGLLAAQEGVTVDGEPVLTFYPIEDVLNLFGG